MMKKTKTPRWLLRLLGVICLFVNLAACDSTEGTVESEPNKPKPEVPVADSDWQVVPSTGGSIEKDNITIDFPSGTFSNNTKVAITGLKEGAVCGEEEVSGFYMITMPITTHKPTTFRIKCDKKDSDIQMILHSTYLGRSTGVIAESDYILDTKYSNGEYSAQLTTFDNEDETINLDFKIGLAHVRPIEGNSTRSSDTDLVKDEVKGIKWKLCVAPKANNKKLYSKALSQESIDKLHIYINDAITKIRNQGYIIEDKERVIPYYFDITDKGFGEFKQGLIADKYSKILISVKEVNSNLDTLGLKSMLIHETFHYFQADYDPRCAYRKSGGLFGSSVDDENILYEMGAVWMEQFVRGGNLDADWFVEQGLKYENIFENGDILGLGCDKQRWNRTGVNDKHDASMYQGYSMAPLLYYLTTVKKSSGFNNQAVLELHKLWKEKWVTDKYNAYNIFNEWVKSHDDDFLSGCDIDDYYIKLWKGELIKDLNISKIITSYKNGINSAKTIRKYQFVDNCFPFGCGVKKVALRGFKDSIMTNKELVIKQHSPNVHTYVLMTDPNSEMKKYREVHRNKQLFAVEAGDSIVLNGTTLESLRHTDGQYKGEFYHVFYLVTTNITNHAYSTTINPYQLTFELRDTAQVFVSPNELEFPAKGDTKKVIVNYGTYKYYGYKIENKDTTWIKAVTDKTDGIGVKFTVTPNTTTSPRETTVYCFVANVKESTDADRVYMPVKITQKAGTAPSVTPEKLTFEASGGTQSVKVTAQGYKRFGYNIPQEYTSWLKGKAISGGTVEITAQPNDTGKERTATIKCFVTNVDNATDDQKVFMPVTIVQKAKSQPSTFKIETISLYFDYNDGVTEWAPYRSGKNWNGNNIAISGGHVTCSWKSTTNNSYSELSFDIDDVNKLESKAARISNIKGEGKTYYDDGRLVDLWKISADCQTTNSSSSDDDFTYYRWSWGKNSFYEFSGGGVAWVATVEHPTVLSKMVDAYGYISIKVAK